MLDNFLLNYKLCKSISSFSRIDLSFFLLFLASFRTYTRVKRAIISNIKKGVMPKII